MARGEKSTLCVIVTGGASGIGAAVARKIVADGGYVGLMDINAEAAQALADDLGERVIAVRADALDEADISAGHAALVAKLPPVNGLVNCAGRPQTPTPIEDYAVKDWSDNLDSHLKSTYISCRVIGAALARGGAGAVVNVASVLAFRPGPVLAYGPAKAGVVSLTQSLAVQWASRGVRVNAVAPGWTDTPFLRPKERDGKRDFAPIIEATPLGRLMQPAEIAEVISFLLSPASSAVTGVTIPCDGGILAGSGWKPYGGFPR